MLMIQREGYRLHRKGKTGCSAELRGTTASCSVRHVRFGRQQSKHTLNAENEGDLRVVDESGEDYLFSADRFVAIDVPAAVSTRRNAGVSELPPWLLLSNASAAESTVSGGHNLEVANVREYRRIGRRFCGPLIATVRVNVP